MSLYLYGYKVGIPALCQKVNGRTSDRPALTFADSVRLYHQKHKQTEETMHKLYRPAIALLLVAAFIGWPVVTHLAADPYPANACELAGECED